MRKVTPHAFRKEAVYIDGKDRTDEIETYAFEENKWWVTYKNSDKRYGYHQNRVKIIKSALQSVESESVFSYLKQIAEAVGLKTDEGNNILADHYDKLPFIPEYSILSHYLNQKQPEKDQHFSPIALFPFGFNLSQKKGVDAAFSHPLSIIEGPPGTGKTQTILNIIANAIMNHQSVAVVSSNNSATKNVFDKLDRSGISFITALLGNAEKKKEFIESQAEIPDLSGWKLTAEEARSLQESNTLLFAQLSEKLELKNELALLKLHIENVETEHRHFTSAMAVPTDLRFKKNISSGQLLSLWIMIE